jgi:nucleoside-diphosphate-sugar epimerase
MRILVLGGTQMLGRDFVERYSADHSIVIANRGITGRELFPELEHVLIDRDVRASQMDYGSIGCRALGVLGPVDAVVDFSCYSVAQLESTMPFLPQYGRYVFISTTCVLGLPEVVDRGDFFASYCFKKRECERWLKARGVLHSILRPCVVVGDNDYTNRFERRDGKFFWKANGQEAGSGTIGVEEVSRAIMSCLESSSPCEVNLCR